MIWYILAMKKYSIKQIYVSYRKSQIISNKNSWTQLPFRYKFIKYFVWPHNDSFQLPKKGIDHLVEYWKKEYSHVKYFVKTSVPFV